MLKGFKLGILKGEKYKEAGQKAFEGICKKYLRKRDGKYYLGEFNTNSAGECTTSLKFNFLQIDFENDDE